MAKPHRLALPIIGMAALLAGCSDETPSEVAVVYDIVAFRGQEAGPSTFTVAKPGSGVVATYTAQHAVINTEYVEPGQRLMLAYTLPDGREPYTSGAVNVTGYSRINNAEMSEGTHDKTVIENPEDVYLQSVWLSECYLNFNLMLPYDDNARLLDLMLDLDSADPACPDVYLLHRRIEQQPTFQRRYYISYDISALVDNLSISSFTLHLDNSNLPDKTFTIRIPR